MPKSKRPSSAAYKVKSYVTETILKHGSAAFVRALERKFNSCAVQAHRVAHPGSQHNQCYRNSVAYIKQHGGSLVHCWMLTVSNKMALSTGWCEAIEHFVVRTDSGQYVDPTPIVRQQHTDIIIPTNLQVPVAEAYSFGGNISWYRGSLNQTNFPSDALLYMPRDDSISELYSVGTLDSRHLLNPDIWHKQLMTPHLNIKQQDTIIGETQ